MLILASASPRRRDLLAGLGFELEIRPAHIDESHRPGERPEDYVDRLAVAKAMAVGCRAGEVVLAADTTVDVDGAVFGKPDDAAHAAQMLRAMAGRAHRVHTAVAVHHGDTVDHEVVTTEVRFAPLDEARIAWYVGTGEPIDKAGGYALQGRGDVLVEAVHGSVSNVIGLPLAVTVGLLAGAGLRLEAGNVLGLD